MNARNEIYRDKEEEEKTELLYGVQNAVGRGVSFMRNVRKRMDISFDHRAPSIVIELEPYRTGYIDIRKRGGKIRALTEITSDNIHYCKEIMKIVSEFRHLDGLKGDIAVSETEYMATTILQEAIPLTQVIYSNVKDMVEQGQSIFDTLWNKSISAKQRIKEIEQGTKREFIKTIQDPAEIKQIAFSLLNSATHEILIIFSTAKAGAEYKEIIQLLKKASEHNVIIRILSESDDPINDIIENLNKEKGGGKENINIRHRNKPRESKITIMVVDDLYSLTVEMKDSTATTFDEAIGLATYTNSESTVSSYVSIFETLWLQSELLLYEKDKQVKEQNQTIPLLEYNGQKIKDVTSRNERLLDVLENLISVCQRCRGLIELRLIDKIIIYVTKITKETRIELVKIGKYGHHIYLSL